MSGDAKAWVLNLAAESELCDPAHRPSTRLAAETARRARALVPAIERQTQARVVLLGEHEPDTEPLPDQGDCWCPTPSALARLVAAGVTPPPSPGYEVLRRVNHRAFAADLGLGLPGAAYVFEATACFAVLATRPAEPWLLKRPLGFSGRGRKVVSAERMSDETRRWIEASMSDYGLGLQVEPLVRRVLDCSLHGRLAPDGSVERGQTVITRCGEDGRFLDARLAASDELRPAEAQALSEAFALTAAALHGAGYFGPFGIDAFRWLDSSGAERYHPLSEINARYGMAWWMGMA